MKKETQFNVLLICHECLKELVIPNEEFEPWAPLTYEPAKGWIIPTLIKEVIKDRGLWVAPDKYLVSTPASDVRCYCPEHVHLRKNGKMAELDDCASLEN